MIRGFLKNRLPCIINNSNTLSHSTHLLFLISSARYVNINGNSMSSEAASPGAPAAAAASISSSSIPAPPKVKRVPRTVYFGKVPDHAPEAEKKLQRCPEGQEDQLIDPAIELVDDLFWLRSDERDDPEVLDVLNKENEWADHNILADGGDKLQQAVYDEHISHIKETDDSIPILYPGGYRYYTKTKKGLSFPIYARKKEAAGAEEEILLDVNELAKGEPQCDVDEFECDPSHKIAAYSLDLKGDECYTIRFFAPGDKELTEKLAGIKIENTTGGFSWLPDSSGLIYCTRDEAKRSDKVLLYKFDISGGGRREGEEEDTLLLHEKDTLFGVGEGVSRDGHYLYVSSGSSEVDEVRFVRLTANEGDAEEEKKNKTMAQRVIDSGLTLFRKRQDDVRYSVESHGVGSFFVLTNAHGCKTQKVIHVKYDGNGAVPDFCSNSDPANDVTTVVPHDKTKTYESISTLQKVLIVEGRYDGLTAIWTIALDAKQSSWQKDKAPQLMAHPEPLYDAYVADSQMKLFDVDVMRITFSSMTTPQTWFDVDIADHSKRTVVKRKEVPNFDSSKYVVERRWATAPDGVKIPMSVLRLKATTLPAARFRSSSSSSSSSGSDNDNTDDKSTPTTPPRPCLLYGYGSYSITIDPAFTISPLPLVDRGCDYVIAHVRGGGEMGRSWYEEQGKYLNKRNTFSDFIACAEALVAQGITTPAQLGIEGRSAGGLLVGAVCNMRPDLFCAAINGVGFSDVIVTMQDSSIPLTTGEWAEWGNPNLVQYFSYMRSYCPMQNVVAQRYPNMLFTAGLHDPRVLYSEPLKLLTRIRDKHVDKHGDKPRQLLGKFDVKAGHFSANDRYKLYREKSYEQTFMLKHLIPGVCDPKKD